MLYRKMKKTGDELSILGFGCMRLPQENPKSENGKIDEERGSLSGTFAPDMELRLHLLGELRRRPRALPREVDSRLELSQRLRELVPAGAPGANP